MAITTLYKQPGETKIYAMSFKGKMAKTETINSIDTVVADPTGELTFVNQSINDQKVNLLISGGTNLNRYKITVTVSTSLNQVLEREGYLEIKEV